MIERFLDEDTARVLVLVTGSGCPICDDDGCASCNSQLRPLRTVPKGTVAPTTKVKP